MLVELEPAEGKRVTGWVLKEGARRSYKIFSPHRNSIPSLAYAVVFLL